MKEENKKEIRKKAEFFSNQYCEYYPCHKQLQEINCLFCYCPLYLLPQCPGTPSYFESKGIKRKDCSNCTFPHEHENYSKVIQALKKQIF